MAENKTYKMKVELNEDQILEALATFFGVSSKNVELKLDHKNCHILVEIEKEMQFPEKEKEREYVYVPMKNYEPWDPMRPNVVWCGTQTNPIDISTSPTAVNDLDWKYCQTTSRAGKNETITAENVTTGTTTAQMQFNIPTTGIAMEDSFGIPNENT